MTKRTAPAVILDIVEPNSTPAYCTHGQTTCMGGCGKWLWLGHATYKAVEQGECLPICQPCGRRLIPPESRTPIGQLHDHLRADGPHDDEEGDAPGLRRQMTPGQLAVVRRIYRSTPFAVVVHTRTVLGRFSYLLFLTPVLAAVALFVTGHPLLCLAAATLQGLAMTYVIGHMIPPFPGARIVVLSAGLFFVTVTYPLVMALGMTLVEVGGNPLAVTAGGLVLIAGGYLVGMFAGVTLWGAFADRWSA